MGNFASCTASLSSQYRQASPASVVPHTVVQQLPAVRVLLIDGSMLKFRVPIKVIELLLDYPNHVICPLDSLKPGLHSLSSLLPNEKLQLGRLYLLLPFKAKSMQENSMKSKLAMAQKRDSNKGFLQAKERELERKRLLPRDKSGMGFAGDVGLCGDDDNGNNKLQARSAARESQRSSKKKYLDGKKSSEKQKNNENKRRSEVGWGKCEELNENGDVGRINEIRRGSAGRRSCGKLNGDEQDQSYNRAGRGMMMRIRAEKAERYGKLQQAENDRDNISTSDAGNGPLCDTPELQRAYRSFLLRRSSSWTPRLQPILERR